MELLKCNPANFRQCVSFLYRICFTSVFTEGNSCEGVGSCATRPTFLESGKDSLLSGRNSGIPVHHERIFDESVNVGMGWPRLLCHWRKRNILTCSAMCKSNRNQLDEGDGIVPLIVIHPKSKQECAPWSRFEHFFCTRPFHLTSVPREPIQFRLEKPACRTSTQTLFVSRYTTMLALVALKSANVRKLTSVHAEYIEDEEFL